MSIKELKNSIKEMQEVYDDNDTPTDIKDSIAPSLKKAKEMLAELSSAEKEKQVAEVAVTKAISQAKPKLKEAASVQERRSAQKDIVKKTVAKKEAVKKVATVKSKIEKELPGLMAFVAKTKSLQAYKGKSEDELQADAKKKAMRPGKRISAEGNRYYEYRTNRSDVMPNKYPHLEDGGSIPDNYSINVFGYHTRFFFPEIGEQFENAMEILLANKDREDFYFRNTSEALEKMARAMDHIYSAIERSKDRPVTKEDLSNALDQANLASIYNYKSGLHIKPQFIRDAILTLNSGGIKYEAGGEIWHDEIRDYVNEKIEAAGLDVDEFWEKVNQLKLEPEDSEVRGSLVNAIDDILNEAAVTETVYIDGAYVTEIPYYQPGEDEPEEPDMGPEIYVRQVLLGDAYDHGAYGHYGYGGRLKSAIKRDRAYESDQPWELNYKRKSRPKHPRYQKFAAGGAMPDLIDDFPKGAKVYVDGNQFENSWPYIKNDPLRKKLIETIHPYIYEIGIVQNNTTHSATIKYGNKSVLIPKVFLTRFKKFSADRIKALKLVVRNFIPVLRDFNERFMSDNPKKIESVIKDLKNALLNDDTLYLESERALFNLTRSQEVRLKNEGSDIYAALTEDFDDELYTWAGDDYPEGAEWYVRSYNISPEYVGSGKKAKETIKSLKGYTNTSKKKLFGGIVTVRTPDNLFNAHSGDGSIDI